MSRRSIVLFTIVVGVAMLVALVAFEAGRSEYRGGLLLPIESPQVTARA